jgi:hypothetical protein
VPLEIVYVDDSVDAFADRSVKALPLGTSLFGERVRVAGDRREVHAYAEFMPLAGESPEQAARRIEPVLRKVPVPPGARLALGRFEEPDPEPGRRPQVGWRSYVLRGPPVVTDLDVEKARAYVDHDVAYLEIRLFAGGGERFRDATRKYVGRRMAITLAGRVESCPVIRSEISGGRLRIEMSAGNVNERLAEAQRLARLLDPEAAERADGP